MGDRGGLRSHHPNLEGARFFDGLTGVVWLIPSHSLIGSIFGGGYGGGGIILLIHL